MRKIFSLFLLLFLFAAQNGMAAENGWYLGLGIGQSSIDTGITTTSGTASVDEDDLGFKLFAGYEINEYFAVEGFYFDAGEATLKANSGDVISVDSVDFVFLVDDVKGTIEAQSFGLVAVVGYPVHQYFYPYAKFGFHRWDAKFSLSAPGFSISEDDDGTDIVYGMGFRVDLTKNISMRGEFERYDFDGEDVDALLAGLMYRF